MKKILSLALAILVLLPTQAFAITLIDQTKTVVPTIPTITVGDVSLYPYACQSEISFLEEMDDGYNKLRLGLSFSLEKTNHQYVEDVTYEFNLADQNGNSVFYKKGTGDLNDQVAPSYMFSTLDSTRGLLITNERLSSIDTTVSITNASQLTLTTKINGKTCGSRTFTPVDSLGCFLGGTLKSSGLLNNELTYVLSYYDVNGKRLDIDYSVKVEDNNKKVLDTVKGDTNLYQASGVIPLSQYSHKKITFPFAGKKSVTLTGTVGGNTCRPVTLAVIALGSNSGDNSVPEEVPAGDVPVSSDGSEPAPSGDEPQSGSGDSGSVAGSSGDNAVSAEVSEENSFLEALAEFFGKDGEKIVNDENSNDQENVSAPVKEESKGVAYAMYSGVALLAVVAVLLGIFLVLKIKSMREDKMEIIIDEFPKKDVNKKM